MIKSASAPETPTEAISRFLSRKSTGQEGGERYLKDKKYDFDKENFKKEDYLFNSIMNEPLQRCTLVNSLQ